MSTDTIYAWSTTADDNATADAEIEWSEYQAASSVNNSARAMMRRVAQLIADLAPNVTSTGSVNAYAVTSVAAGAGTTLNDGEIISFVPHATNTAACTLNRDSKGAVPLRPKSGTEFGPSQIIAGVPMRASYRLASNEWIAENPGYAFSQLASSYLASNTFGLKVGDVKLSLSATPDAGFVRLKETAQALVKADYPDLNSWASAQGYPWGSTATTFNIPAAGGYFLRFGASDATVDPGGPRTPGSTQTDALKSHNHTANVSDPGHSHTVSGIPEALTSDVGSSRYGTPVGNVTSSTSTTGITVSIANTGDVETRGKNVAMYADMLAVPALVASGLVGAAGLAYRFSAATAAIDPGVGYFALNNSVPTAATALYASKTDGNGASLANILGSIRSGALLYIVKVGAPANNITAVMGSSATDNGAWDTFSISDVTSNGTIAAGDQVSIVLMAGALESSSVAMLLNTSTNKWEGDGHELTDISAATTSGSAVNYAQLQAAIIAAGAGDVVGPAAAVDDRIATFDGATGKLIQDSGRSISTLVPLAMLHPDLATATKIRVACDGQSNAVGSAEKPSATAYPTFDADVRLLNNSTNVFATAAYNTNPLGPQGAFFPHVLQLLKTKTGLAVDGIMPNSTSGNPISLWTGTPADRTVSVGNRPNFVAAQTRFSATGWTEPVHFFHWSQGPADTDLTAQEYVTEFEYLIDEFRRIGMIGDDTVIILHPYYQMLNNAAVNFKLSYDIKNPVIALLERTIPNCLVMSYFNLQATVDSGNSSAQRIHADWDSVTVDIPQRCYYDLSGRKSSGGLHSVVEATTKFGNIGARPQIEKTIDTPAQAATQLDHDDCMRHIVRVKTGSVGSAVTIRLPDVKGQRFTVMLTGVTGTFAAGDTVTYTGTNGGSNSATVKSWDSGSGALTVVKTTTYYPAEPTTFTGPSGSGTSVGELSGVASSWLTQKGYEVEIQIETSTYAVTIDPVDASFFLPKRTSGGTVAAPITVQAKGVIRLTWGGWYWIWREDLETHGTWTPAITFSTSNPTTPIAYTTQTGTYKVDREKNRVSGWCKVLTSGAIATAGAAGSLQVSMPFAAANTNNAWGISIHSGLNVSSSRVNISGQIVSGNSVMLIRMSGGTDQAYGTLGTAQVSATVPVELQFSFEYDVSL